MAIRGAGPISLLRITPDLKLGYRERGTTKRWAEEDVEDLLALRRGVVEQEARGRVDDGTRAVEAARWRDEVEADRRRRGRNDIGPAVPAGTSAN